MTDEHVFVKPAFGTNTDEDKPLVIALYARVSMDEVEGGSRYQDPENQLIPLREWCKARHWIVQEEFVDKGSGADPNRPMFRSMIARAHRRQFDAIMVWKMDRFSREPMSIVLSRVQELRRLGVGIISHTESWMDTTQNSPVADLVLAVMAWASAEERRKISERTKAGIQRLRNIGQWRGGRPRIHQKRVVPVPHDDSEHRD